MLIIKDGKVVELAQPESMFNLIPDETLDNIDKYPYDIAALSSEILPSGCPIATSIFIVDKVAAAFCDGQDRWYRKADTPVDAGKPISALF